MARYPKYYVRPDGLHETILRINGKRKAFRGKTDKEVWEKVKAFDREADRIETEKAAVFEKIADAWWSEIEPTLEHNTQKSYRPALVLVVALITRCFSISASIFNNSLSSFIW